MLLIQNFLIKMWCIYWCKHRQYFRHLTETPLKWRDAPADLSSCWISVASKVSDRLTE